ncbi:uncharacterized protein K444DRAFT_432782 [Hyaloscypha bicolor E]|jgi:hypothetical protein|uniref:Uncharacterized protein n=1 Tax=Hyaloscypha bicolor E TaxID=1095630 RepID=A0A2J6T615_9HELO|nr:uncharacterized protein K444DRAFT_432782 [Hyaloscypha bicolor E]PMD58461.1 hypothetical protein K444DRAFT_432782 [Hyaloscypha bicolor E]
MRRLSIWRWKPTITKRTQGFEDRGQRAWEGELAFLSTFLFCNRVVSLPSSHSSLRKIEMNLFSGSNNTLSISSVISSNNYTPPEPTSLTMSAAFHHRHAGLVSSPPYPLFWISTKAPSPATTKLYNLSTLGGIISIWASVGRG